MGLEQQGAKPSGFLGKLAGRLMNRAHTPVYRAYFKNNLPPDHSCILDIGCGGGEFLNFLAQANESFVLYGLDHSPEMIALSAKINKHALEQKRLKLLQSSVSHIALENSILDLVCAFETVQFWDDISQSFSEIYRILKKGGQLLLINRYPKVGTKWWDFAQIKSDYEYIALLEKAGFNNISIDLGFKRGWIVVKAYK